jgi:hypothetical protein
MPVKDGFGRLPVLQRDDHWLLSMAFIGMGTRSIRYGCHLFKIAKAII